MDVMLSFIDDPSKNWQNLFISEQKKNIFFVIFTQKR